MSEEFPQTLDATVLSEEASKMQTFLLSKIIGQPKAVEQFVKVYQQISVGMNKENRPAGIFLFTGPTGVGKTELVRQAAQFVLGRKDAITRIDCGEFQASHEISKLLGSPPGYVGFADKESVRLSQEKLDQYQTAAHKINFLLFDEIEEAHETLLSAILQILDAGRLTLGNGSVTDFTKTIIILTSNLGEKEMQQVLTGSGLGLAPATKSNEDLDDKVYRVSKTAATRYFKAKFMNRIDCMIVFRSLSEASLREILKIEMYGVQDRLWRGPYKVWRQTAFDTPVPQFRPILKLTEVATNFIIKEGTSQIYGARELNRVLERLVVFPLGALVGSKQIQDNDIIELDYVAGDTRLTFRRTGKRDISPLQYVGGSVLGLRKTLEPPKWTPGPAPKPRKPYGYGGL